MIEKKQALIFGGTGNIGGATTRELLKRGWNVRAVTRNPTSEKALVLTRLGADVVQADMDDPTSLKNAFEGITKVMSVQNWSVSGIDGEIRQAKQVANAAITAGINHLVYISAGMGEANSGVPHFDSKLEVEDYMRELGLPVTVVRPAPFMELLSEKEFYPPLAAWGAQMKIIDWETPLPWVAVRDIGLAVANIFENPDNWVGKELPLFGDIKSMNQCKQIFTKVNGKKPFRIELPLWLFKKMAGEEFVMMWRWLYDLIEKQGSQNLVKIAENAQKVNPEMLDVENWLQFKHTGVLS
jgi:uncharacterized protein YbjT (DUF2867 family)